ncbi:MAG TPA: STAS domain-containing protein [Xanthomarina sp.]|nr:STAS domain-containing protein [Xanthomarina sp.]
MNLTITYNNNLFEVTGALNRQSVKKFQEEFEDIFEKLQSVTISIGGLQSIDRDGVKALARLHNQAIVLKKQLSIVGFGCKDLYTEFKTEDAA